MYGICIGDLHCSHDPGNIEIRVFTGRRADTYRFVCKTNVQAFSVCCTINSHRFDTHFLTGTDNPQGDLAPVGDQNLLEHVVGIE